MTRRPTISRLRRLSGLRRRRGFTAVEIAMVATVIAILALLILPIFRERTEAARRAAVEDELASIAKAQLLAEADLGMQLRLNDMDNGPDRGTGTIEVANDPPIAAWNGTLETSAVPKSRETVVSNWGGPYLAFKNFLRMDEINPAYFIENGGPLYHITAGNAYTDTVGGGTYTDTDVSGEPPELQDRYPVDPWGSPYIFFGRGLLDYPPAGISFESEFNSSIIYSLGPNGTPADESAPFNMPSYRRENAVLGNGDDYEYRF